MPYFLHSYISICNWVATHKILRKFLISICLAQYKKSAEQLFVSSQALSKVIKKIENELDILLFTRTSQGLMH